MKTTSIAFRSCLLTSLVILLQINATRLFADEENEVVRGTLIPFRWISNTVMESVAIRVITSIDNSTDTRYNEEFTIEDYVVANNSKGRELVDLDLVGEDIEAIGSVVRNQNGDPIIYISDYKIISRSYSETDYPKYERKTISGIIVAIALDEHKIATKIAIRVMTIMEPENEEEGYKTFFEDFYALQNEKGQELLKFVGLEVEASGIIKTDQDDVRSILVSTYKLNPRKEIYMRP
jgi:hypothetical protein